MLLQNLMEVLFTTRFLTGVSSLSWLEVVMLFQYFADHDMLYIKLADKVSTESEEIAPGVVLDFDNENRLVGVEIEDASKLIDLSHLELRSLPVTDFIMRERNPEEKAA